jgi:hypothetical protein
MSCVRVETGSSATPGPTPTATISGADMSPLGILLLVDCGTVGSIVVDTATANVVTVANVSITRSSDTLASITQGIDLLRHGALTASNMDIGNVTGLTFGLGGYGIVAQGNSSLTVTGAVTSKQNRRGVYVTDSATANIDGLTAFDNDGISGNDGLRCDATATIKVRNSSFTGNYSNGVSVFGYCAADLGTAADPGNNVFNTTSAQNGGAGLCVTSPSAVSAYGATFGCGYTGTGCTSTSAPTTGSASSSTICDASRDIDTGAGASVTSSGATCCY